MDETGINNRSSALENGFFLFCMLIMLFVRPFKGAVSER